MRCAVRQLQRRRFVGAIQRPQLTDDALVDGRRARNQLQRFEFCLVGNTLKLDAERHGFVARRRIEPRRYAIEQHLLGVRRMQRIEARLLDEGVGDQANPAFVDGHETVAVDHGGFFHLRLAGL